MSLNQPWIGANGLLQMRAAHRKQIQYAKIRSAFPLRSFLVHVQNPGYPFSLTLYAFTVAWRFPSSLWNGYWIAYLRSGGWH